MNEKNQRAFFSNSKKKKMRDQSIDNFRKQVVNSVEFRSNSEKKKQIFLSKTPKLQAQPP